MFHDYFDLATGRTLVAEPGGTYDVAPSGGRLVPDLPHWFVPVEEPASKEKKAAAEKITFVPDDGEDDD